MNNVNFFFLAGLLAIFCQWSMTAQAALPTKDIGGTTVPTLAPVIKQSIHSVVNIATTNKQPANHPLFNNPMFREFYNLPKNFSQTPKKPQSVGSGVIINSKDGIIITNHHVINGADAIEVILHNGDTLEAELLGSDPEVDVAVLKVKSRMLDPIPLGNSDKMEVGDFVIAIGSPFGLKQTVTTGIVSALGRSGLGIEGYEDFIQTDASINPGNSGGALINLKGEVIGINTAIIAPAKGNVGIGFAIPINMAMNSVEQIIKHGEVKRGRLGIVIQDIDAQLAKMFKLKDTKGILVADVQQGSAAEKAGLQAGDIILAVDDEKVNSAAQLRNSIGAKRIDDKVTLRVFRDGKKIKITARIGNMAGSETGFALDTPVGRKFEGLTLTAKTSGRGLEITAIAPNAPALGADLRKGDVLLSANQLPLGSIRDLQNALKLNDRKVLLQVQRNRHIFFLVLH